MKKILETNYKLLDSGNFEKLEQIEDFIFLRPAPQASWKRKLEKQIWENHDAKYDVKKNCWLDLSNKKLPIFQYNNLSFSIKLSPNRQIGIFPEQLDNWHWLNQIIPEANRPLNILNGFAYTGASTLYASASGTDKNPTIVTHVDAASASVNWAKENCTLSKLDKNEIRWYVDDILTFLAREVKRGNKYDGIILDPPAFGRGKKGTTWKIKRDFSKLMNLVDQLLSDNPEFIILSCHDKDFGKKELKRELSKLKNLTNGKIETMNLTIKSENGNDLPSGNCARWKKR